MTDRIHLGDWVSIGDAADEVIESCADNMARRVMIMIDAGGGRRRDDEHRDQVALMRHFAVRRVPGAVGFAIPNGGYRSKATAARLQAEGVVAGVPDLWFSAPGVQPLWMELKRTASKTADVGAGRAKGRGRLSAEQESLFAALRASGSRVEVAFGLDEALAVLEREGIIRPAVRVSR